MRLDTRYIFNPKPPPIMKIKFKKKKLVYELIPAIFWTTIAIESIISTEKIRWTKFGLLFFGLSYLVLFIFNSINQYLTIENGIIQKNGLFKFRKKINLADIIEIKTFAGDYTLITQNTELKIQVELIADDSLVELKRILSELNLPAEKTPFHD